MAQVIEDRKLAERVKSVGVKKIASLIGMHPKSLYAKLEGYINLLPGEKEDILKRVGQIEATQKSA